MITYKNKMTTRSETGGSYAIDIINYTPFSHNQGIVTDRGYGILFSGSLHLLKLPETSAFSLKFNMFFAGGEYKSDDQEWGVVFGYDKTTRNKYEISVKQLKSGGTVIALLSSDESKKTLLKEQRFDYTFVGEELNAVDFTVKDGKLTFTYSGCTINAEVEQKLGRIGFWRGSAFLEIVISDVDYLSLDDVREEKNGEKIKFVIPRDNGEDLSYYIELGIGKEGDDLYRLDYTFGGGFFDRKPGSVDGDVWAFMYDDFYDLYLRVGKGKRLYLFNGMTRILDNKYDNIPLNDVTTENYKKRINVPDAPLTGCFYVNEIPDGCNFSVGYSDFASFGSEYFRGSREYVFDRGGKMLYNGEAIDLPVRILVTSPINKRLVDCIPPDTVDRENVIKHLEGNHYFDNGEKASFDIKIFTELDLDLISVKAKILDAFFAETEYKVSTKKSQEKSVKRFQSDKLPIGVYHMEFDITYCGKIIKTHKSAFEVLDTECKISPQKASGLPEIYAGDGAPANMRTSCADYRNTQADYNIGHYHSITNFLPHAAEHFKVWKLNRLFCKKTLTWFTQRAIDRADYFNGNLEKMEILKHSDYVNYGYPGIENTRVYYRYDYFEKEVYENTELKLVLGDFLKEHPSFCAKLGYSEVENEFTDEQYRRLLKLYSTEWIDFANKAVKEKFDKQWKKIKQLNPDAKRQSYGPWNVYSSPLIGAYSSKWFGGNPKKWNELIDGFYQLEDYPLACSYSTSRSAWALTTIKELCPKVKVYPEIYNNFGGGCPDGFVSCANPPLGDAYCPLYFPTTQISEYVFDTAYYKDGKFDYWRDYGFMFFALFMDDISARYEAILRSYGVIKNNLPSKPTKGAVFIYDIDEKEDRIDLEFDTHAFYNISEVGESFVYKVLRENGIASGFFTDYKDFESVPDEMIELLVLPSTKNASRAALKKINSLHEKGIKIIAVGSVSGLEDVFGVRGNEHFAKVSKLTYNNQKEAVTSFKAEFRYEPTVAEKVVWSDNNEPVVIKNNNTILLNVSVCQVGVDNFRYILFNSRNNISRLLEKSIADFAESGRQQYIGVDEKCGVTLFENKEGKTDLMLVDYSEEKIEKGIESERLITVRFNGIKVCGIKDLCLTGPSDLSFIKKDGAIEAFSVTVKNRQTLMFELDWRKGDE